MKGAVTRTARAAGVAVALSLSASRAYGQGRPETTASEPLSVTTVLPAPAARRGDDAAVDLDRAHRDASGEHEVDAVVARGTPRSFQIVTVPVPAIFGDSSPVSFEVITLGTVPLLGARQGVLVPNGTGGRAFSLTIGVPARALAGRRRVAKVRFAAPGMSDVVTPVDIEVAPVRRIDPLVTPSLVGGRAGADVTLHVRLTNLGNAPDTVTVHVQSTDSTNAAVLRAMDSEAIVLGVNMSRDLTLQLAVARSAQPAVVGVVLAVRGSDGGERSRTEASVEIVTGTRGAGGASPALTTSLATPLGGRPRGSPVVASAVGVQGLLGADLRIDGRWTRAGTNDPSAAAGLTRLGYYDIPPSLALSSSSWRVTGGGSGARLTDLTGGSVWGVGAASLIDGDSWRGAAMIAEPGFSHRDPTTGMLAGATASHRVGAAWVTGSLAHMLEDQELFERRLDALSVGAQLPVTPGTTVDAELAGRSWAGGDAVGARFEAERRSPRDNATLRLLHAPGGSMAFAPARDELSASMSRVVARRLLLSASGWWNSDAGALARGMRSSGWSVQPQVSVSERTSMSLRMQASDFDMAGAGTTLHTAEHALSAVLSTRRTTLYGSGSFGLGTNTRASANTATAMSFDERLVRSTTEMIGGWTSALGTIELDATAERNLSGIGLTPDRSRVGVRLDRVAVYPNWSGLYVSGSLQRTGWLGERQRATIGNLALTGELPYGLRATLGVQHNSFFAPTTGRWTTVLGVERAMLLPQPRRRRRGMVYEDLNGNGRRDEGEPGFAGAVVRSGTATVATSADGRFRLPAGGQPAIDGRSLPAGWLPGATSAASVRQSADLGVVPTSVIEVELVPVASGDGRTPTSDVHAADVMARDAADHLWMARQTPGGVAVFDALPPGDYRLELDLTRLGEPLTTREALPTFTVQAAPSRRRYAIAVMPRPLKMWRPPASALPNAPTSSPAPAPAAAPASGARP